ncbi:hypothetical protein [Synechococcus sp. CCY 9618]|uniref:hypothetical protein n=1 Tax=Synechococcus sp. CCY 9618 TaxID=2815602 RepID=UPI0020B303F3|nr:hypothetical protein [Synechococcus sp. CCY 9618]
MAHHLGVEAAGIHAQDPVVVVPLTPREAVGQEDRPQQEAAAQLAADALAQGRPAADQQAEDVASAFFNPAPGLDDIEQGGEVVLR